MSITTGKDWKVARYSGASVYNIGGIPSRPSVTKHATTEQEAGTGQRRAVHLHATNIFYEIAFKMKLQTLADYITTYSMITAEGSLPSHYLYVYDGVTKIGFTNCFVDKCDIEVKQTGAATVDIAAYASTNETKDLTVTPATTRPITKSGFAVTIGGTSITKWTDLRLGIDNGVKKVPTGTSDVISEVFGTMPTYSGRITFLKTGAPQFAFDTTLKKTIVITIVDNQGAPVTVVLTFTNAAMKTDQYYVEELNETYEVVDWTCDQLTIS